MLLLCAEERLNIFWISQGADVEDQLRPQKLPGRPAAAQPENHAGPPASPGRLPAESAPPAPPAAL